LVGRGTKEKQSANRGILDINFKKGKKMFEKLISTLMASRDQAHVFHWQTTGDGSFAAHMALGAYYEAIPGMVDALVEAYQGKHGILKGFVPAEKFDDYDSTTVLKYFKALASYIDRAYKKIPADDTNIINQLDAFKDLIYTTIYKLENLR
jgi:DNA-binding ferritin-like protein